MDRLVFRPLRHSAPAVMLVRRSRSHSCSRTSRALVRVAREVRVVPLLLNRPVTISGVDIRKITIVAVVLVAICLFRPLPAARANDDRLRCGRRRSTSRPRACSGCGRTAVIAVAVLISGAWRQSSVMLTVLSPQVTPSFALQRHDHRARGRRARRLNRRSRRRSAVSRSACDRRGAGLRWRAAVQPEPVPADLSFFTAVILVLLPAPRLSTGRGRSNAYDDEATRPLQELAAPAALVVARDLTSCLRHGGRTVDRGQNRTSPDALVRSRSSSALWTIPSSVAYSGVLEPRNSLGAYTAQLAIGARKLRAGDHADDDVLATTIRP